MNAYRVTWDGVTEIVITRSLTSAIIIWREKLFAENSPHSFDQFIDPDSVELLYCENVLFDNDIAVSPF